MNKKTQTTESESNVTAVQEANKIPEKKDSWTGFFIFLGVLVAIFIATVILNNVLFMHVEVCGTSMENTISNGDILIANKKKTPNYGDIVIIVGEKSNNDLLIKRVIGKGGDSIKFLDGKVYLKKSGEEMFTELKEDYVKGETKYEDSYSLKEVVVPQGEIFYMGDNRENSSDSRGYFSTCKESQIISVVENWSLSFRWLNNFLGKIFSPQKGFDG